MGFHYYTNVNIYEGKDFRGLELSSPLTNVYFRSK